MNDKIQLKRGTLANWLKADPILMDGEMALVATDASKPTVYDQYKVGGGSKKFSELPYQGLPCLQELGASTTSPMSQKAIKDLSRLSYPLVLAPSEITMDKSYLNIDYSIAQSNNFRIRKLFVKKGDAIFISGTVQGDVIVAALFTSLEPSSTELIEEYARSNKPVYIDTIAKDNGYLIVTENSNANSLIIVINSLFARDKKLEELTAKVGGANTPSIQPGYIEPNGNIGSIAVGYFVYTYPLKKGDIISYEIEGMGNYIMVGVFSSPELSASTLIKSIGNAISSSVTTYSGEYRCEREEEYVAFTLKGKGYYFNALVNSLFISRAKAEKWFSLIEKDIEELKDQPNIVASLKDSYLNPLGEQLNTSTIANYRVDLYDVTNFVGGKILLSGGIRGYITVYGFTNSVTINPENTISVGDKWSENSKITPYNKVIIVPDGAKYLCLTVYDDEGNSFAASKITINYINESVEKLQTSVEELKDEIETSSNITWLLKDSVDKKLSNQYPTHNIPLLTRLGNRYDFCNIKLQSSFTVPEIGATVNISISSNPDVYINYSSTEPLLKMGDKICVGTKTLYDTYEITKIDALNLTCRLIKCNTGLIGKTLNMTTDFPDISSVNVADYIKVFKESDILSYASAELPRSLSFDGIHPNNNGYSLCSQIIADIISMYAVPTKIYAFGDSWTHDSNGWHEVGTILGCTMVNYGVQGDRIEHIMKRFLSFMESYTPKEGDVFLFVMGTNNLLGISRDSQNDNKQVFNYSYVSTFLDACETISSKLPKGNWFVANGHSNSNSLK